MATKLSSFGKGVFLVLALGIVYDKKTGKILIGRRENAPHIKKLSWVSPGGRPNYGEELEDSVRNSIKSETGLKVKVRDVVFAKTYPERREFLSIYYCCKRSGGRAKAGGSIAELKWVRPTEVKKYFTTSLHPKLLAYLKSLEHSGVKRG
jgi:8-oxo-dGTP diphosphatase